MCIVTTKHPSRSSDAGNPTRRSLSGVQAGRSTSCGLWARSSAGRCPVPVARAPAPRPSRYAGYARCSYAGIEQISEASLTRPGQAERSLATHTEIVEAIERRDEEAAMQLMVNHLAITGEVQSATAITPTK